MNYQLDRDDATELYRLYVATPNIAEFALAARRSSPSFATLGENALRSFWLLFDVAIDQNGNQHG